MRIATSTTYAEQAATIDDTYSQYQHVGQQLSSGISLNAPSDNPNIIGPDILLNATIASETQDQKAATGLQNQLTTVDTTLNSLTNILQSARTLAVQSASSLLTDSERQAIAGQIDQLLSQSVGLGNTQFAGTYVFAGTKAVTVLPVQGQGTPITGVQFLGNEETHTQVINGQAYAANVTLQQAFNFSAADGSKSVFQVLQNLRDTLNTDAIVNTSAGPINKAGSTIFGAGSATPTTLAAAVAANAFAVPLTYDSTGKATIEINAVDTAGNQQIKDFTLSSTDTIDGGGATALTTQINAWATGSVPPIKLTASFGTNGSGSTAAQNGQRFTLTSTGGGFYVKDVASAGATNSSNLAQVLGLSQQTDVASNVSIQIGDIDKVLNVALNARANVGARINSLANLNSQLATFQTDNVKVKSGYEDTSIPDATAKFSQTQLALQAAYSTTSRLEAKSLLDYVSP